ncbi:hypothetical protein AVEN_159025-1 [Araneus ventricosus]|uniref:Uncharacterized protein n=1 Tax=Araneus ventricosus TaxID=182803 RepID=A0A4Y2BCC2_ARAVE|nr:hypothetical protein AVEN_159025-1 [Araneus ventricosus]
MVKRLFSRIFASTDHIVRYHRWATGSGIIMDVVADSFEVSDPLPHFAFTHGSSSVNFTNLPVKICSKQVSCQQKNASLTVPRTGQRLPETRWSVHYEAVKPVFKCFKKIVDGIEELCDASETVETRGATQPLLPAMCDFSFLCLWNNVLKEVYHVQKYLQVLRISFEKSVIKMRSLKVFLKDKRNDLVEEALKFAKERDGHSSSKRKNCQAKENCARREGCIRAADLGPETEKVNVIVH